MKKTLAITASVTLLVIAAVLSVLWNVVTVVHVYEEMPVTYDAINRSSASRHEIAEMKARKEAPRRTVVIKKRLITGETWKEYLP